LRYKERKREVNSKVLIELATVELGGFGGDFDLIPKDLLASSCQFLGKS